MPEWEDTDPALEFATREGIEPPKIAICGRCGADYLPPGLCRCDIEDMESAAVQGISLDAAQAEGDAWYYGDCA